MWCIDLMLVFVWHCGIVCQTDLEVPDLVAVASRSDVIHSMYGKYCTCAVCTVSCAALSLRQRRHCSMFVCGTGLSAWVLLQVLQCFLIDCYSFRALICGCDRFPVREWHEEIARVITFRLLLMVGGKSQIAKVLGKFS